MHLEGDVRDRSKVGMGRVKNGVEVKQKMVWMREGWGRVVNCYVEWKCMGVVQTGAWVWYKPVYQVGDLGYLKEKR